MSPPQVIPKISGIILAAGLSTRMGEPKQLLPFGNSTIIETVIDNLLGSKLNEVIVVVGHEAEKVQARIRHKPVEIAFNPDYQAGMLTSCPVWRAIYFSFCRCVCSDTGRFTTYHAGSG